LTGVYLTKNSNHQTMNQQRADNMRTSSSMTSYQAAYLGLFPFEIGLVTVVYLLVLQRMFRFSIGLFQQRVAWAAAGRIFFVVVIAASVVAAICNIVSAVQLHEAVKFYDDAAAAFAANATADGMRFEQMARDWRVRLVNHCALPVSFTKQSGDVGSSFGCSAIHRSNH
jgi:uncharacterized membrane protein